MSIEQHLLALTAAVEANTAALLNRAPAAAAAATETKTEETKTAAKTTRASKTAPKPDAYVAEYTQSEMQAAVNEVKSAHDTATAKALIKTSGHDRLADVTDPKKIDDLYKAAKALLEGDAADETDADDDI